MAASLNMAEHTSLSHEVPSLQVQAEHARHLGNIVNLELGHDRERTRHLRPWAINAKRVPGTFHFMQCPLHQPCLPAEGTPRLLLGADDLPALLESESHSEAWAASPWVAETAVDNISASWIGSLRQGLLSLSIGPDALPP